jgi:tRNA(Ile)-lysidine synthase
MDDVIDAVARTIRTHGLIVRGDRIAAAVSGGSDSVALAWLLHELVPRSGAELAGLVHVNHGLRGAESDADAAFCRQLAERLGLPIELYERDAGERARARGISIETAARDLRYECFEDAATRLKATLVATGHTEDDQAETVLLRLLRGAGTRGLSGIRIRRGRFVRPLLETRREDLRQFLTARGETWREDASNTDVRIARNRIRHELLPVVRDIAPSAVRALARLARLASDDEAFLEAAANEKRETLVLSNSGRPGALTIDSAGLAAVPPALSSRLVRRLAADVAPGVHLSARHLEAVCRLAATDKPVGRLDLPGLTVRKWSGKLEFAAGHESGIDVGETWPVRRLDVPGSVSLPEAGLIVEASVKPGSGFGEAANATRVVMPLRAAAPPFFVRNRRPGDRLQPLGAPGHRKLQDLLVDRKVPRGERDAVPIVTASDGEILWVAGVAVTERCRVEAPSNGVLLLELRKGQ